MYVLRRLKENNITLENISMYLNVLDTRKRKASEALSTDSDGICSPERKVQRTELPSLKPAKMLFKVVKDPKRLIAMETGILNDRI